MLELFAKEVVPMFGYKDETPKGPPAQTKRQTCKKKPAQTCEKKPAQTRK